MVRRLLLVLCILLVVRKASAQSITLDFESDDDGTPLVNGQAVEFPAAFGLYFELTSVGNNLGLALYDSTVGGPNDPGTDADLLVGEGNLLIMQSNDNPAMTGGAFDVPNDSTAGGDMIFDFAPAVSAGFDVRVDSIDVVDRDLTGRATLTLTDAGGLTRTVNVPAHFTGEINHGEAGIGTVDLASGNPTESPENPGLFTTVITQPGFDIQHVVRLVATLQGSGAVDNLELFLTQLECQTDDDCPDSDLCTMDQCIENTCQHPPVECVRRGTMCNPADGECVECLTDGHCVDQDPCTVDACAEDLTCTHEPLSCPDNADPCTTAACDPGGADGNCALLVPAGEGSPCDDGDQCNSGEVCTGGICGGGTPVDCSHLNGACVAGVCNPASGACVTEPANQGQPCDDGNPCNSGEACTAGLCGGGSPVTCPETGNPCTLLECDPGGAPGNCDAVLPRGDGTPCDDADSCTEGETCVGGTCGGGAPVNCSGLSGACVTGVCSPASGQCVTQPANEQGACDDGAACTVGEVCAGGTCGGGTPVNCSALSDACHVGACNALTGQCMALPAAAGTTCDDGDPCSGGDTCQPDGACRGTPIPGCGAPVPVITRPGMLLLMGALLLCVLTAARRARS